MSTKTNRPGRPAAKLNYPSGLFTIGQLYEINKDKVKHELSIRQHIEKARSRRWVSKERKPLETGTVGKPPFLYKVTKRGMINLNVILPVEAPKNEIPAEVQLTSIPLTPVSTPEAPVTVV